MGPRTARRIRFSPGYPTGTHSTWDQGVTTDTRRSLAWRYALLLSVAGAVVVLDQLTKSLVSRKLEGRPPVSLFGGLVHLLYARNTGAAFSILPNGSRLFVVVALIVCAGILLWYPRLH